MKDAVKQRIAPESVYCSSCGGWLCDVEMENGRVTTQCKKCHRKMIATVHGGAVLVYKDRRGKTA